MGEAAAAAGLHGSVDEYAIKNVCRKGEARFVRRSDDWRRDVMEQAVWQQTSHANGFLRRSRDSSSSAYLIRLRRSPNRVSGNVASVRSCVSNLMSA